MLSLALAWTGADAARPVALERYQVTHYDATDGAPTAPSFITQTDDGFIWAVSSTSLHRFDGTRFERWRSPDGKPPPTDGASAFAPAPDNTLWVGSVGGGISAIRGSRVQIFGAKTGLPNAPGKRSIQTLLVDGERVIAATRGGLFERKGDGFVPYSPVPELVDKPIDDLRRDTAGRLWIKTPTAIHVVETDGATRQLPLPAGPDAIAARLIAAPDGSMWYGNHNGPNNLCRVSPAGPCWRADDLADAIFDRDGTLWWSRPDRVLRVAVDALDPNDPEDLMRRVESIQIKGGGIFESRDGAVWVHGASGITRLRRPVAERTDTPSGGLASGDGGSVWLASYTRGLMHVGDAGAAPGPALQATQFGRYDNRY